MPRRYSKGSRIPRIIQARILKRYLNIIHRARFHCLQVSRACKRQQRDKTWILGVDRSIHHVALSRIWADLERPTPSHGNKMGVLNGYRGIHDGRMKHGSLLLPHIRHQRTKSDSIDSQTDQSSAITAASRLWYLPELLAREVAG